MIYYPKSKSTVLVEQGIGAKPETANDKISSIPDLLGTQIFVEARQIFFDSFEEKSIAINPEVKIVVLNIGGQQFWIRQSLLKVDGDSAQQIYTFIFPKTEEELYNLR